ncbi:MAG: SusF/SusE family outer membrane protein [Bacteroidales bacterium]
MMKRTAILLVFILGISFLHSCEKDEKEPVLHMDEATAPSFTNPASGSSYTLTADEEEDVLFAFEWAATSYPLENLPDIRYLLQADKTANNWEYPDSIRDITDTRDTSYETTVSEMNQLITQMGVEPFETGEVSFRVRASLTTASEQTWLYSAPVDLEITTYEQITEPDTLFVPGSWQDWDVENSSTVLYSPDRDGLYEGYLYFEEPDTEIKFATAQGWDESWGDGGDGTLDPDGGNIVVEDPGVYKVNVDMNEMTYEVYRTEWAVIGDAIEDWDTDVPLNLDTEHFNETWKVRYTLTYELSEGDFKFRANQAWDPPAGLNMGIDEDAEEEGVLMYAGFGNDIPVNNAGEYTIVFDLSGPVYRYELQNK